MDSSNGNEALETDQTSSLYEDKSCHLSFVQWSVGRFPECGGFARVVRSGWVNLQLPVRYSREM